MMNELETQYVEAYLVYLNSEVKRRCAAQKQEVELADISPATTGVYRAQAKLLAGIPSRRHTSVLEPLNIEVHARFDEQTRALVAAGADRESPEILARVGSGQTLDDILAEGQEYVALNSMLQKF